MSKPISFFWFIPTHVDGSYLGSPVGERQPDFQYFKQIAQAADRLGFEGVLLPTGENCEESWITATGLATVTERLKFHRLLIHPARPLRVRFDAEQKINLPHFQQQRTENVVKRGERIERN